MFACTSRRSVAANDKLLLIDAFYFDPGAATPAWFVNGIPQFADETLKAVPLNFRKQCSCIGPNFPRQANDIVGGGDNLSQHFLSQSEWQADQTTPIQLQ